jgi:ArsR family transcriptional regulator
MSRTRAAELAEILKGLGHPLRLRIVAAVAQQGRSVTELARDLAAPQAIVSQQLRILRMHRLVAVDRQGGRAHYSLAEPRLRKLLACLEGTAAAAEARALRGTRNTMARRVI